MGMKITDVSLLALQTAYMQRDITTQGFCAALDKQLQKSAQDTYNILMYSSIGGLKDTPFAHSLLDELAWQFHVDYYDKNETLEVKKSLVKQSMKLHRKKGTPQAVIDLLNTAFPSDTIMLEWFEYGGKPYSFKIITGDINEQKKAAFLKALGTVKNARSYLESIEMYQTIWHYASSNIAKGYIIEYAPEQIVSVAPVLEYSFQNGESMTFGNGARMLFLRNAEYTEPEPEPEPESIVIDNGDGTLTIYKATVSKIDGKNDIVVGS